MSKSICALVHRPGTTREEFQAYYESNHAPLAVGLFPFTAYVRNHLVDPGDFGWDTISEFWSTDIAATAALMEGPIGDTMRADEEKFMDRSRIAPGGAEEVMISPGEPADRDGRRTALLLSHTDEREDFRGEAIRFAERLGARHAGVSADFVTPWQHPAFPAAAVVWVAGWPDLMLGEAPMPIGAYRARRIETPPSQLRSAPGRGASRSREQ